MSKTKIAQLLLKPGLDLGFIISEGKFKRNETIDWVNSAKNSQTWIFLLLQ